jgi:hypothetical protein
MIMATNKIKMWGMCLLLVTSVFLYATVQAEEKTYDQVMDKLESLTPSDTIEVRMGTEKEEYEIGESFEMRFEVSQDSYIVLMHIASDGNITFLTPSKAVPAEKLEGERVYSTLYDFDLPLKVIGPGGIETINLFSSLEKIELFDVDSDETFPTITINDEEALQKLLNNLEALEEIEWSGNSVSFLIKGARGQFSKRGGLVPPIGSTGTTGKFFPPIGSTGTTGKSEDDPKDKTAP